MKKKIIAAALAVALFLGGYAVYHYRQEVYLPEKELTEDIEKTQQIAEELRPDLPDDMNDLNDVNFSESPIKEAEQINEEIVCWLTVPNTSIDYPVAQGSDNSYYLSHSFDGEYNQLGSLFLDYRCEPDFKGYTSIVYGHHFVNNTSLMFGEIFSFKNRAFLEQHRQGYIVTSNELLTVDFFAYLNVMYDSPVYHTVFLSDDEKRDYLDFLFDEAMYTLDYSPDELLDKRLILLSTCTYEFNNARGVLVGVID